MANDPVLSASVIGQSVAPSCSVRNFVSDEVGRILMVPASSAPLNVSVAASTVNALSSSTSQIGTIGNSSFTVGGSVDVGSINNIVFVTPSPQWTVTVSTANTQSVAVSSAIALSSGTIGLSSAVAVSTAAPIFLSTAQSLYPSTAATYPVAVSSAITLTSGTLTLGVLSTTQVVTTTTTSTIGLTTTSLVSLSTTSVINNTSFTVANIAEVVPTSTVGTQTTVSVTSSTATQLLLAPNASRKGVIFFAGTSPVYLAFTSTAALSQPSTTNYSVSVAGSALYALTLGSNAMFTGGVLAVAGLLTGSTVKVTEFT